MTVKQRFNGPVWQVSGGDTENNFWLEPAPPDDPDKSTQCPQCGKLTWRHSRMCIHCQLDLVRWRARQRWARMAAACSSLLPRLIRRLTA